MDSFAVALKRSAKGERLALEREISEGEKRGAAERSGPAAYGQAQVL